MNDKQHCGASNPTERQPYYFSLAEASRLIASKHLSPVELLDECLDRIDRFDGNLHSFLLVTREMALAQARLMQNELMSGRIRGPLHGIPYGLKDVIATAGIPTTGNSPAFLHHVPTEDATVVRRLAGAGGVLIGKLATHELTYGGVSFDLPWPPTRNPWDIERDSGGSSSGTGAAVASGFCTIGLGTDTGGSVRNPAALCGIVGLKPTLGLVSRYGITMNSQSLDACGPMTRTVEDAAIILGLIAGYDPLDRASADRKCEDYRHSLVNDIRGIRIGVIRHFYESDISLSAEAIAAVDTACEVFEQLGARIENVTLPSLSEFARCKVTLQLPEIYSVHRELLETRSQDFGKKFLRRIQPGAEISAIDYLSAQQERRRLTVLTLRAMDRLDVLLTAGPGPAALVADVGDDTHLNKVEITVPFSLTGMPAISIRAGVSQAGLPLAIQLAGRHFEETTVLKTAHAFEQATHWHKLHPNL